MRSNLPSVAPGHLSMQKAGVNGIDIAYRVVGAGPPLVLIMGYRMSSSAWPPTFVDLLSRRFTVIVFDNRGTGLTDKPVEGYALSNMAADVCGLLDHLGVRRANILGYSMGGAIAQQFALAFPERLSALALCATLCGGSDAVYARPHVLRTMHELDGLSPEEAARCVWKVTYSPTYLAANLGVIEAQMQREIASPTPLHAADLQFQALVDFDCSGDLSQVQAPTLVLAGDLDELVPPRNSKVIAQLIARSRLVVIPGCGHRVMWEAAERTAAIIGDFFENPDQAGVEERVEPAIFDLPGPFDPGLLFQWPAALAGFTNDLTWVARRALYLGNDLPFGDGKPVVVVPGVFGDDLTLSPLVAWLKGLGYRPTVSNHATLDDTMATSAIVTTTRNVTARIGRKAVIVAFGTGTAAALRAAEQVADLVSDVIAIAPPILPCVRTEGVHLHSITFRDEGACQDGGTVHRIRGAFWLGLANRELQHALSSALHVSGIQLLGTIRTSS